MDFDPNPDPGKIHIMVSKGSSDAYLSKFDQNGNFLWVSTWGGASADVEGNSVTVNGSGESYVTGYFDGTVDFNLSTVVAELTSNGGEDVFLSRFKTDGSW